MRKTFLLPLLSLLFLSACASEDISGQSLEERLKNPLFAEWYYDELVDRMVDLQIRENPILEDENKAKFSSKARRDALKKAGEALVKQREGMSGFFVENEEYTTGEALYVDDMVYFGENFITAPHPSLHVFLDTAVDPTDAEVFPGEETLDLGLLRSPYGSQRYTAPPVENPLLYRTVVLFDTILERITGFAQLSPTR